MTSLMRVGQRRGAGQRLPGRGAEKRGIQQGPGQLAERTAYRVRVLGARADVLEGRPVLLDRLRATAVNSSLNASTMGQGESPTAASKRLAAVKRHLRSPGRRAQGTALPRSPGRSR